MATINYGWNAVGTSFFMNTATAGNQTAPDVAGNAGGTAYAGIWKHGAAAQNHAYGRVVNSDGIPGPSTFDFGGDVVDPHIAGLADGRFVVTGTTTDGGFGDIRFGIYNADGSSTQISGVIDLQHVNEKDRESDVAALADGGFVVTWTRDNGAGNNDIYAEVRNADGLVREDANVVNTNLGNTSHSSVAALASDGNGGGGGFVVAWQESPAAGGDTEVRFRRFDANGTALDGTYAVGVLIDTLGTVNKDIQIAGLPDGGFVVAYTDNGWGLFGDGNEITARVYNADGTPRTGLLHVNSAANGGITAGIQDKPTLTVLPNGFFVVGWSNADLFRVQAYDANGNPIGSNTFLADSVIEGEIAGLAGGRLATAFETFDPDASGDNGILTSVLQLYRGVTGNSSDETIAGVNDGLTQYLNGQGGNDTLVSGASADYLEGGDGFDFASYASAPTGVFVQLDAPSKNTGDAKGDTYSGIEGVIGSAFDDTLAGDYNVSNTLIGGAGSDTLYGRGPAVDTMIGGIGDDIYYVHGPDIVTEQDGEGTDTVNAQGSYKLAANVENVNLVPAAGAANATGNELDNVITGNEHANVLAGLDGNDLFTGGLGDDSIDGGAGEDTAVYAFNFGQSVLQDFHFGIVASGPDGTDALSLIEHLQFADTTITLADLANDGNALFDSLYYYSRNTDVYFAGVNALDHYNAAGWHEGRDPNAFFDTSGYLAVNKDVAAAGINPLEHYHQSGWKEGRDPGANFDTKLYLAHNPDVAAAGIDPLEHFLNFGFAEGRQAYAAVGNVTGGFDAQYYLFHNPDVAAAGVDALQHFNQFGSHEGRQANAYFDTAGYLSHYGDVAAAGVNPLEHYMQFGWKEGRDPSAPFDTQGYLAANPDVAAAGINPLEHYLTHGIYEGRQLGSDGMWG